MSGFSHFDLIESTFFHPRFQFQTCNQIEDSFEEQIDFTLNLLNPNPTCLDLLPFFEPPVDPIRSELRYLSDRIAALEIKTEQALAPKKSDLDRKYKWTKEIKSGNVNRKYQWTVDAKAGEERRIKWKAEINDEGKSKIYTFEKSSAKGKPVNAETKEKEKEKEKEKVKKGKKNGIKLVEIDEGEDRGTIAIRKAFAKYKNKGKKKELSPQDAATIIQMTFRTHLIRRSQVVRCLRALAVAKAKLKEIRALFYNFSYRRRITTDAEERQRFAEKIIVLLLTVDAIEGPDYMVRAARKSMVEELDYMLDTVDPQQAGKPGSLRRRKFDLPAGGISKELAKGVSEVVQMLNDDDDGDSM